MCKSAKIASSKTKTRRNSKRVLCVYVCVLIVLLDGQPEQCLKTVLVWCQLKMIFSII